MKLYELLGDGYTEIQSEYVVVYYDDKKNERIEIAKFRTDTILFKDIKFIYCKNDIIYIEVENDSD